VALNPRQAIAQAETDLQRLVTAVMNGVEYQDQEELSALEQNQVSVNTDLCIEHINRLRHSVVYKEEKDEKKKKDWAPRSDAT